jgi:VIT1/CCC1 family predicted Fe2+/Mn2+ transporter
MHVFFILMMVAALLAVLGVLVLGVVGLVTGRSSRRSNRLMQYRVALQFLALMLMALFMLVSRR